MNVKPLYNVAVFSCLGLGDGLIALVLSNNLKKAGYKVDTFHPFLDQMEGFFPGHSILSRPKDFAILEKYDRLFFIYEKLDWMQSFLKEALDKYSEKTHVLNPIATPNRDYLFWEEGQFNGNQPFVENLVNYCEKILKIENSTKENGLQLSDLAEKGKYLNRVIIHPTSSRPGKNWSPKQFLQLAEKLEKEGFSPIFILSKEEKTHWPEIASPLFENLQDLTTFIAESGWMIGNDSGIGHLASCVGIPTLTICRSQMIANFWRPVWAPNHVIVPPKWIPNLKGIRWRDKKWQHFISVNRVFNEFLEFRKLCILCN